MRRPGAPDAPWRWISFLGNLALLEAGNEAAGLLVTSIDLAERQPWVSASAADGTTAAVQVDPSVGATALRQHLQRSGLTVPEPAIDASHLRRTDPAEASPLLVHAWVLDEFTLLDAFRGQWPREHETRIELREISGDTARLDITVHLVAEGYCVRFPMNLDEPDAEYTALAYTVTGAARRQDPHQLERIEPHHGTPTYRGPELQHGPQS